MATLNFRDHLTNFLELMGTIKRTFQTVKVIILFITHETILKDDSELEQHSYVANGYNIIPTLQCCVAVKIIVTNSSV